MRSKRRIKKRFILALLGVLAIISAIGIPNRSGILKAVGFWDSQWIPSTTGAVFETQGEVFTAKIGNSEDHKVSRTTFGLNGTNFSLTLGKSVAQTTPTPTPILLTEEDASLAAQIAQVNSNLSEISTEVLKMTGDIDQALFGPHETVRQHEILGGDINSYIDNSQLVQEWRLASPPTELEYIFNSETANLRIEPDQSWSIISGNILVAKVTNELFDDAKNKISLPTIDTQVISSQGTNQIVKLQLSDISKPVTLIRRFIPQGITTKPTDKTSFETTPNPTYLATFGNLLLSADPISRSVMAVSQTNSATIISNIEVTGLACLATKCYISTPHTLISFLPTDLLNETDAEKQKSLLTTINYDGQPLNGLTSKGTQILATTNANPNGELLSYDTESGFSPLRDSLNFPNQISTSTDKSITVMLNANQIEYAKSGSWQVLSLPQEVKKIAAGNDGLIYVILTYTRTNSDIVLRINPDTKLIEILSKITGNFTSILEDKNRLLLGENSGNTGDVWSIDLSQAKWLTTSEFSTNLPL